MNDGQSKFLAFFLAHTQADKQNQAKQLLQASFAAQAQQKMTLTDFQALQQDLLPLLKPESVDTVKQAMAHFASQL